jgi:hypothetical protein
MRVFHDHHMRNKTFLFFFYKILLYLARVKMQIVCKSFTQKKLFTYFHNLCIQISKSGGFVFLGYCVRLNREGYCIASPDFCTFNRYF